MFIRNWNELTSHSHQEGRKIALDILEGGLAAADTYISELQDFRKVSFLFIENVIKF